MRASRRFILLVVIAMFAAVLLPIPGAGYYDAFRADRAYANKQYDRAAQYYASAARRLFWREDLLEKAGISAGRGDNCPEAIDRLARASSLSEDGWLVLGYCHYIAQDLNAARAAFEKGAGQYPSAKTFSQLAFVYRAQKEWTAERAALENQIRYDKDDAFAHYRLGLLLTVLDAQKALPHLMLASSLNVEFDSAVQTLRVALNISATQPDSSQQKLTIGRALGLVQEWDLSLVAFEKAVDLDPKNAEAWAWLGEAKQQIGQDGRADLDQALRLDDQSVVVRALRGLYWLRQGKHDQALAEYLLAAKLDEKNPAWQSAIGQEYARLGDLASALTAYQRATELAPDASTYWRLLAVFCAEYAVHVEDVGLPAAQKAVDLAPNDLAALDTLGWLYLSSGRYFTAEETLLKVIAMDSNYLSARLHLAMTYLAQGRRAEAFNELIHIKETDPNGEVGQLADKMLKQYFP